jgi:hypothetical protein
LPNGFKHLIYVVQSEKHEWHQIKAPAINLSVELASMVEASSMSVTAVVETALDSSLNQA